MAGTSSSIYRREFPEVWSLRRQALLQGTPTFLPIFATATPGAAGAAAYTRGAGLTGWNSTLHQQDRQFREPEMARILPEAAAQRGSGSWPIVHPRNWFDL